MKQLNMRNKLLLFAVVFGMCFCVEPKYIVKKQSELATLDLNQTVVNYIPLADRDVSTSTILDSTYRLLSAKKYAKLNSYLNSLETSGVHSPDFYLSKTFLYITYDDYLKASVSLRQLGDADYLLLKRLLAIDLKYELAKANGGFDYSEFLKGYQDLIDSYPNDFSLKKIAGLRLRYIRYNY